MIERSLVGVCGGNRLHFKVDALDSGEGKGGAQAGEGELLILFRFSSDEPHRSADHCVVDGAVEFPLGKLTHIAEDAGDELFKLVATAKNFSPG